MPIYEFGPFTVDVAQGTLSRRDRLLALPPKLFAILAMLVENHGRSVTKDELIQKIWADTIVEESNLRLLLRE